MVSKQTNLMERLQRAGIMGRELAALLDVTPECVSNWSRGARRPPLAVDLLVDMLADAPERAGKIIRRWMPRDELVRRPIKSANPHPLEGKLDRLEGELDKLDADRAAEQEAERWLNG